MDQTAPRVKGAGGPRGRSHAGRQGVTVGRRRLVDLRSNVKNGGLA
jgi:hypothetical protein